MIDALLRIQLAPLIERLAEIEAELEDLRRRDENHNRIGIVVAVDPAAGRCQVSHGDLRTPWIRYFNPSAGEVSETRHPSVGEQCLLINFGAGDGSAQSVALTGIPSAAFAPVSDRAELHRRTYPDGAALSYDHLAHLLNWQNGPLQLSASREAIEIALGGAAATMTSDSITMAIGGTELAMTAETLRLLAGGSSLTLDAQGLAALGALLTHNGKNVGGDHKHPPGTPLSGPPQ